jgi:SOS-response transcriptional repressor LexA
MSEHWIETQLINLGKMKKELAEAIGQKHRPSTVTDIINGKRPIDHSLAIKLAGFLRMPLSEVCHLAGIEDPGSSDLAHTTVLPLNGIIRFPIIGKVEANTWRPDVKYDSEDPKYIEIPNDNIYPGIKKFGLDVVGESMNEIFPHGCEVLCIDIFDLPEGHASPEALDGKYVVVRRTNELSLVETTLKKYVLKDGSAELWPESNHPDFQEPIELNFNGEEDHIQVEALVLKKLESVL